MKIKEKLKIILSGAIMAAMALSFVPAIPASAETGTDTYSYEGYSVDYSVTNEWNGGQSVEVKITNTGDEPILNWALKYDTVGEISSLWNGNVYSHDETEYIIKNANWNYEIAPYQSVMYG